MLSKYVYIFGEFEIYNFVQKKSYIKEVMIEDYICESSVSTKITYTMYMLLILITMKI